jgi:CheY-like chemotaxis protein
MKNTTIVLIDDSKEEIQLFKLAFNDVNTLSSLITFNDAPSAFDYIVENAKRIFIILCDISMPRMSGFDLLEKINADHQLKMSAIPFIFFTNSSQEEDVQKAYSLTAQGFFQKPMNIDDLESVFNSIVHYWRNARIPHAE